MTDMPSALHQLVESVTDTYTVVAEHPRPGDIRPSVWEVKAPGHDRGCNATSVKNAARRRLVAQLDAFGYDVSLQRRGAASVLGPLVIAGSGDLAAKGQESEGGEGYRHEHE